MKYLVIYAHPNPKSFNAAIKEEVEQHLRSQGKEFSTRDLYQLGFQPALNGDDFTQFLKGQVPADIKKEQDFIRQAETLIFIYPVWWFGMPAVLKGYIDRVFFRGFAYDYVDGAIKGLLTEKKVIVLNTTGGLQQAYDQFGFGKGIQTTIDNGIFAFCGMTVALRKYFYAVPTITTEARAGMLEEIRQIKF